MSATKESLCCTRQEAFYELGQLAGVVVIACKTSTNFEKEAVPCTCGPFPDLVSGALRVPP
jgi:hypothetical protein